EQAALDELATRDRDLLQELLEGFARAYAGAKERESGVDFEDLQLNARDLLREHEEIKQREAWRFRAVMVDEFQDTNRLQCDLVDLIAGDELFFVGDEFQSIYGFRHADVNVFRERRGEAGSVLPLTLNYRSRPEVLAAVNHLFGSDFGHEFQPLAASGDFPDPVFGTPVELLVTDKSSYSCTRTLSLERLCEEIVAAHDYDLAVLAQWDGRRRYANLRKLARLARSYEELRGADIEGFVRFVREQDEAGAKELEAVAEEEDADVI